MSDEKLIDDIIGFDQDGDALSQDDDGAAGTFTYAEGDDDVAYLKETIMSMQAVIESMDKRIARLEVDLARVTSGALNERTKTMATMPKAYAMKHTVSPVVRRRTTGTSTGGEGPVPANIDAETESFSNLSMGRSDPSTSAPLGYVNRMMGISPTPISRATAFKNNSATSARGYDNKLSLWGTVFASLMVSCMRRYIMTTGETGHVIDEMVLMKTYTRIVGDLYHRSKFAELPAVQSHEVALLSKVFERKDKVTVPESQPSTWMSIRTHTDGNSCMSVVESIVTSAKLVPEAMLHPVSRLVMAIEQPVVVEAPNGPTYAIPSDTVISMTPTGFETFCSWLKKESLKTYVKYRLNGDSEITAINKMVTTMKDTDLFDNKNLYKGRELLTNLPSV
ncbi:hypothetical protein FALBO_13031 [Fusarium albosuccineum]|uniref:Uncharacterized protein n=1 Tax=Fusarium albosuccineum TaxID=1237068 RepID=A0A8H4L1Y7_9HYPO|nr:hypothetical protein FALBO_13031 [Fusarium albosuccineum]